MAHPFATHADLMKILLVYNTYQEPGGEEVVFGKERRLLEEAGHEVFEYRSPQ